METYSVWVEDLGMDGGVRQFETNYFVISKIMERMLLNLGRYFETRLSFKIRVTFLKNSGSKAGFFHPGRTTQFFLLEYLVN